MNSRSERVFRNRFRHRFPAKRGALPEDPKTQIKLDHSSCSRTREVHNMTKNTPAVLRSALYALRGGFLIRPFVIAFLGRNRRRGSVLDRGAISGDPGHRSVDPVSLACRPSGGAGHPHHHCDRHHDGRLHRFCDPLDDLDAGVHAVFAAHPHQLRPGSGHAMDARDLSRHVFLLHRGPSRGAIASLLPLCRL